MFIYELLLLKLPFEDMGTMNGTNINLKGHVMSGGRPMITAKVHLIILPLSLCLYVSLWI